MKYVYAYIIAALIVLYLMLSPANAATGHFKACANTCREFDVTYYTASEIKEMKPKYFCQVYVRVPPEINDQLQLVKGYALEKYCKKIDNMNEDYVYNFINPELK